MRFSSLILLYALTIFLLNQATSKEAISKEVPQNIDVYPDSYRWHSLPAFGIHFRYVKELKVNDVVSRYLNNDERPALVLDEDAHFYHVDAQKGDGVPSFILNNVSHFSTHEVKGIKNIRLDKVKAEEL